MFGDSGIRQKDGGTGMTSNLHGYGLYFPDDL